MSIMSSPFAMFDIFFVPNYWVPTTLFNIPVGVEGFIFSFFIGGLSAVSYAEISKRTNVRLKEHHKKILIGIVLFIPLFIFLLNLYNFPNVMISAYLAMCIGIFLIVLFRRDLIKSILLGAFSFGTIYTVCFFIILQLAPTFKHWFILDGLPKLYLLNIPIYEIIFAVLFAAYWGSLYEIIFEYKYSSRKL